MTLIKLHERIRTNHAGFTLLELVVAMVIFSMLMALAVLNQGQFVPGFRLRTASRQVAGDLQLVRAKAISQNTQFRMTFNTGDPTQYYVQRWNPAGGGAWENYALYGRAATAIVAAPSPRGLPDGVQIQNDCTVTVRPRGSAQWSPPGATAVELNHTSLPAGAKREVVVGLNGMISIS